jgi:peptidoglycan hydrolase-like protein with peptidoglycan-binding domain
MDVQLDDNPNLRESKERVRGLIQKKPMDALRILNSFAKKGGIERDELNYAQKLIEKHGKQVLRQFPNLRTALKNKIGKPENYTKFKPSDKIPKDGTRGPTSGKSSIDTDGTRGPTSGKSSELPASRPPKASPDRKKSKWRKCSKNYKRGCSGDMVKTIQSHLGFKEEDIDGKFGGVTKRAVVKFQEKHGLKTDGIVGEKTYKKLSQIALAGKPKASPKDKPKSLPKKPAPKKRPNSSPEAPPRSGPGGGIRRNGVPLPPANEEKHPVGNGPRPVNENQNFLKSRFTRLLKTERS